MPESWDVLLPESVSFDMAPVYGHDGVEFSGHDAVVVCHPGEELGRG